MPSAAAQRAPEPKKTAPARNQTAQQKNARPAGVLEKLRALPQAAGVAIMAALLVAALFVGNARALDRVSPGPFLRFGEVASCVEDRAAQAENALNVVARALDGGQEGASRAEEAAGAVRDALEAFRAADGAREVSRADQALTAAVSEMTDAAGLSGEDARSLQRALDNFAEQGSFLRQEARAYNEQADKAAELYRKLPTRFVLDAPERYEGI